MKINLRTLLVVLIMMVGQVKGLSFLFLRASPRFGILSIEMMIDRIFPLLLITTSLVGYWIQVPLFQY